LFFLPTAQKTPKILNILWQYYALHCGIKRALSSAFDQNKISPPNFDTAMISPKFKTQA
jgi:hypothetical protein